jgi:hypothetical protein
MDAADAGREPAGVPPRSGDCGAMSAASGAA